MPRTRRRFPRHCETSYGPRRRHLSRDEVSTWADRIRQQAERAGVIVETGVNNSELLDHPQWRKILADLGRESLGPPFATNGRAIARDPSLLDELKQRGVEWLQLTLGGGSAETHDWFTRRRGSFDNICRTAQAAHERGLHVVWMYIAYRPIAEIARMSELAKSISAPFAAGRYDHKGGIDQGIYLIKPQAEGTRIEQLRPTRADLAELPEWACGDRFCNWFGAGCATEGELVTGLSDGARTVGCLELGQEVFGGMGLVVCRNGDVYPYCHERQPKYLLGNLSQEGGLETVLGRLHGRNPPLALAVRRRGLPELAARYGDPEGDRLHSGCSLCRTLVARALGKEQ